MFIKYASVSGAHVEQLRLAASQNTGVYILFPVTKGPCCYNSIYSVTAAAIATLQQHGNKRICVAKGALKH